MILFKIEDIFSITGRGTVVTGALVRGKIRKGDKVSVPLNDGTRELFVVEGLMLNRRQVSGIMGPQDKAALLFRNLRERIDPSGDIRGADFHDREDPAPGVRWNLSDQPQLDGKLEFDVPRESALMLLPLRIETFCDGTTLKIRAFPDAMHADATAGFSESEVADGNRWESGEMTTADLDAAAGIARSYAIRQAVKKGRLVAGESGDRPLARSLPPRLIYCVSFDTHPGERFEQEGKDIPKDLPTGPGDGDTALLSRKGDPLYWIADFDTAVEVGMALTFSVPPGAKTAKVAVIGAGDMAVEDTLDILAKGPGLTSLFSGQTTKGEDAGTGGPLASLPDGKQGALHGLLNSKNIPDTLTTKDSKALTNAILCVLWEAAIRPTFVFDKIFGQEGGLGADAAALDALHNQLWRALPDFADLPVLSVGRTPVGIMGVSTKPSSKHPWLGKITKGIREAGQLSQYAETLRSPAAPADDLAQTLARMPFGQLWRDRARWEVLTVAKLIAAGSNTYSNEQRRMVGQMAANAQSADKLLTDIGFRTNRELPFSKLTGSPIPARNCGPLIAEGGETSTDIWADPVIEDILHGRYVDNLLNEQADRRKNEGPEPLFRVLCEDAMRNILADMQAVIQQPDTYQAANVRAEVLLNRRRAGETTAHRLMETLLQNSGGNAVGVRDNAPQTTRSDDLRRLIGKLEYLLKQPQDLLHHTVANVIDWFSLRPDIWIEGEARIRLEQDADSTSVGAWGYVEDVPLTTHPDPDATYLIAPSQRLARLAGFLARAEEGFVLEGMDGIFDAALTAPRVKMARRLMTELTRAGRYDAGLTRVICEDLQSRGAGSVIETLAETFPDPEEEGQSPLRFDALALIDNDLPADLRTVGNDREALDAVLAEVRDGIDILGAVMLAEGGLALTEGRPDRASGILAARGAGAVPPADPEVLEPRVSGAAIGFGVGVTGGEKNPLNDIATRLIGELRGEISLTENTAFTPLRSYDIANIPSPLALVRLSAPDRDTAAALAELACLSTGRDPEGFTGTLDDKAQQTIWAAARVNRLLSEARPFKSDDFADPQNTTLSVVEAPSYLTKHTEARIEALEKLMDRLKPFAHQLTLPDVDLDPRPQPGPRPFPTPEPETSSDKDWRALAVELICLGIIKTTKGIARGVLAERALRKIEARIQDAKSLTGEAAAKALDPDMPVIRAFTLPPGNDAWARLFEDHDALEEWLEESQVVRSRLAPLSDLVLGGSDDSWAVQWPGGIVDGQNDWIGGKRVNDGVYHATNGIVFNGPKPESSLICGLMIDQWQEVVPDDSATIGAVIDTPTPTARAPQVALIAPPDPEGKWTLDTVFEVVSTAVNLAKLRSLTLTDLPSDRVELKYRNLGNLLPFLSLRAADTGIYRTHCNPGLEPRYDQP